MEKIFEWIGKHKAMIVTIAIALMFGVPFVIHVLFKYESSVDFFVAEWSAGDVLQYYASIISGVCTVILACVAITQTHEANVLSNRMLKTEELENKTFVKINLEESEIINQRDKIYVKVCLENISHIPVSRLDIQESKISLYSDDFLKNDPMLKFGKIANEIEIVKEFDENGAVGNLFRKLIFKKEEGKFVYIVMFLVDVENILGYKSKQIFNLFVFCNNENNYKIENYRVKTIVN